MFLRALDGAYKGEIREFGLEAGRALLAAGRAEDPFSETAVTAEAKASVKGAHAKSNNHIKSAAGSARR